AQLNTPLQRKEAYDRAGAGSDERLAASLAMAEYGELDDNKIKEIAANYGAHKDYIDSVLRTKNKEKMPLTGVSPFKIDGTPKSMAEITQEKRSIAGNLDSVAL